MVKPSDNVSKTNKFSINMHTLKVDQYFFFWNEKRSLSVTVGIDELFKWSIYTKYWVKALTCTTSLQAGTKNEIIVKMGRWSDGINLLFKLSPPQVED